MKNQNNLPRAYIKDFAVRLGPFKVVGSLYNIARKSDEVKTRMASPSGKPVQQVWREEGTDTVFTRDQLTRVLEVGKTQGQVDAEAVKAARESELPMNVVSLSVHPASDVSSQIWSADNTYVFVPHQVDDYYGTMFALLSDPKRAFLGLCNLSHHEGFFRMRVWNKTIVFEKMLFPENMHDFDLPKPAVDKSLVDLGKQLLEKIETPFDPTNFVSSTRQRMAALAEQVVTGESTSKPASVPSIKKTATLIEDLEAFLNAASG